MFPLFGIALHDDRDHVARLSPWRRPVQLFVEGQEMASIHGLYVGAEERKAVDRAFDAHAYHVFQTSATSNGIATKHQAPPGPAGFGFRFEFLLHQQPSH